MEGSKMDRIKASTGRLVGRTNERLKQKMGRSSESVVAKDDKWQVITANFNRQQAAGMRLHREVKGYIASLKTMESSTQTLLDAVREMHEYTWPGNMNLVKALQGVDKLNKELNEQMVDSLLVPVNNYVEVFSQMKVKMQKRERKLIDHTRTKRTLDTLKKGDKISPEKLGFAQDNYMQNKIVFEEVNSELCEDLPAFWDSRKTYIMQFLDGFFRSSIDFHKEFSQVYSESKDALDPLKEEIKNELPPQRDIAIVDKYFVVSENARKFKRQSVRKSFRKSGGSFKRSLSMGALRKSKKNADTSQSISNISVDPYASPAQQATVYTPTKVGPVKPLSPARPKPPRVDLSVSESEPDFDDDTRKPVLKTCFEEPTPAESDNKVVPEENVPKEAEKPSPSELGNTAGPNATEKESKSPVADESTPTVAAKVTIVIPAEQAGDSTKQQDKEVGILEKKTVGKEEVKDSKEKEKPEQSESEKVILEAELQIIKKVEEELAKIEEEEGELMSIEC